MTGKTFDPAQWLREGGRLVDAIGQADFPKVLLGVLYATLEVDTAFIVAHSRSRQPVILEGERVLAPRWHEVLRYLEGPYLLDPVYQACVEGRQGVLRLEELAPDGFQDSEYYRTFYAFHGLTDEVNFLFPLAQGETVALSLGRIDSRPPFSEQDLQRLRLIEPLVIACGRKHWSQAPAVQADAAAQAMHRHLEQVFDTFGQDCLTERESEVARLLLRGHSSKSIAQVLDISTDTVRVHRKNIHSKLDISSQGELFSLFIDALARVRADG